MNILENVGKTAANWAIKNSPTILTCVGAAGVILTAVASGQAAIKAKKVLDEMPEDADTLDKAKAVAPIMIKPAILAGGTMWCMFKAKNIVLTRNLAITAACAASSKKIDELEQAAIETVGENKAKKINEKAKEIAVNNNPPSDELLADDSTKAICFDELSGRYFKFELEKINGIINKLNDQLVKEGVVNLNEWYEALGLSPVKYGESLGWVYEQKGDDLLELVPPWQLTSVLYKDTYPVRILSFITDPAKLYED